MDAIWDDISEAPEDIETNTMYITLNLARVLAYKKEQLVLSKKEGGDWGIKNLPQKYHTLICDALREYSDGVDVTYDLGIAREYAEYMINSIK